MERNRGPNLWHQPGPCWERRRGGAYVWILSPRRRLHLGSTSDRLPGLPRAPTAPCQPRHPAGRAAFLESQLKAIRMGKTAPPDLLRLPTPTWDPPATQNRRRVQLPPPPPKSDSASMMDQSQQQRLRNRSLRGKKPSDRGEPENVVVLMDPPHRSLVSHALPSQLRDVPMEGLDLSSGGLLTGTR